jgi:hypothetical protein
MSRPALPEERGADLRPEPPTLDELRADVERGRIEVVGRSSD